MTIVRGCEQSVMPEYKRVGPVDFALLVLTLPIACLIWCAFMFVVLIVNLLTLRVRNE